MNGSVGGSETKQALEDTNKETLVEDRKERVKVTCESQVIEVFPYHSFRLRSNSIHHSLPFQFVPSAVAVASMGAGASSDILDRLAGGDETIVNMVDFKQAS